MNAASTQRIVVILGPTAGGKSDLAVAIASHFGGQIISADSMQIYLGLDAGTAKPTAEQQMAAVHHLIDVVPPTERFTVADWLERAEALIAHMHSQQQLPIVVGGTNLYIKALLEGMFDGPPADDDFRNSLQTTATEELHAKLAQADSASAQRIDRNDRKRIIRALEVFAATGKTMTSQQTQWHTLPQSYRHNPILIGLHWGSEAINRRINARVKLMFQPQDGSTDLVTETRALNEAGLLGEQARQAIGTKQVLEHLQGSLTTEEAMERVKIETRRFAKNQRTWLKRYRSVRWLEAELLSPEQVAEQAIAHISQELGQSPDYKPL